MKDLILILMLFYSMFSQVILAQNIINDPSFEDCYYDPQDITSYPTYKNKVWKQMCGTAEIYHRENVEQEKGNYSIPNNRFGFHPSHSGDAYIGSLILHDNAYATYIQQMMIVPMLKNQRYEVSFYIRYANIENCVATWNIGAHFSKDKILCIYNNPGYCENTTPWTNNQFYINSVHPQKIRAHVCNPKDLFLINTTSWKEISGYYTAEGGEQYITLGAFYMENEELDKLSTHYQDKGFFTWDLNDKLSEVLLNIAIKPTGYSKHIPGFYFIDDVSVVPVDSMGNEIILYPELLASDTSKLSEFTFDSLKINEPFVLNTIYFDLDKSELKPESYEELDSLVNFLRKNESIAIEISGHTDNTGSDEYNLTLSELRAKSVANYLIQAGIDETRIKYKGYGNTQPLSFKKNEASQKKNRRVEFKVIEK